MSSNRSSSPINSRWVVCPYEETHVVPPSRAVAHVEHCRKIFIACKEALKQTIEMGTCKYNFAHKVPKQELDVHHDHCMDRFNILRYLQRVQSNDYRDNVEKAVARASKTDMALSNHYAKTNEDWNEDCGRPSFTYSTPFEMMGRKAKKRAEKELQKQEDLQGYY